MKYTIEHAGKTHYLDCPFPTVDWGVCNCPKKLEPNPTSNCKHELFEGDICQDCFERHPELVAVPMGVSEWMNHGKRFGYWDFFDKEAKKKMQDVLTTIEKIAMINNEDEKDRTLLEIYTIAHAFAGHCCNPHEDWKKLAEKTKEQLKDY